MLDDDLRGRGIQDARVLAAMAQVPRSRFVTERYKDHAYADSALPIEENQTISQPYIVALMTQSARLSKSDRVLEIGTGSGYQAAVLAEIVKEVYSIEIIKNLADQAKKRLTNLGYSNVKTKHGDGYRGWKEHAPYDAILITAAAPKIPEPLVDQLKIGGRLVIPLGSRKFSQDLITLTKTKSGVIKKFVTGVVFVPMTGEVRE